MQRSTMQAIIVEIHLSLREKEDGHLGATLLLEYSDPVTAPYLNAVSSSHSYLHACIHT